jgi:hypothetical protein
MTSDQARRASDRDQERASSAVSGMLGHVNRQVITTPDQFLDGSRTGRILPILVRPGAIRAELDTRPSRHPRGRCRLLLRTAHTSRRDGC